MLTMRAVLLGLIVASPHAATTQAQVNPPDAVQQPIAVPPPETMLPERGAPYAAPAALSDSLPRAATMAGHARVVTPSRAGRQAQAGAAAANTADRKGFIVGFGAGPALHRRAEISIENQSGTVIFSIPGASSFSVVTDFKIGYAPTDQLLVYYSNLAAFTRDERYDAIGFSGGGVTYMARPTSPTAFVTGGIGIAAGRNLIEDTEAESGVGYSIGAGWEFSRHWSIDGGAMFVRLGDGDNHTVLRGGFHYLFY